ncbi:Cro/C1-type helix-turn-helix domain [Comamonadaceae bacterium]
MSKPEFLGQLIDLASEAAGSDYKLAAMLETSRSTLSQIKAGKRPCPLGDVALMAEIAGLKPEEWVARALVAQYEGTSKGDKLYRALGKALVATGAVIASSGASAHQIFSHKGGAAEAIGAYLVRCILC